MIDEQKLKHSRHAQTFFLLAFDDFLPTETKSHGNVRSSAALLLRRQRESGAGRSDVNTSVRQSNGATQDETHPAVAPGYACCMTVKSGKLPENYKITNYFCRPRQYPWAQMICSLSVWVPSSY